MDKIPFKEIRVNEVTTQAAERLAGVKGVTSILACVEYRPD